jgi:putative flippase GtrA
MPATIMAQFPSIVFAYLTNRKWVFHSQASTFKEYASEIASFFAARIGTALLDMAIMFIFAEQMGLNDMVIKIVSNVVVIVLNYVASKFWIFKSKK